MPLDDDPWSYASYLSALKPKIDALMALRDTERGACWLLGNGPSLWDLTPAINASPIPKIGVNKALGFVWPLDYCVICHLEHLDAVVPRPAASAPDTPPLLSEPASKARWLDLETRQRLFIHGTSSPRGLPIPISHHALFSTDLSLGASEGTPATGGSVLLVAMQLAYHLGFRTFLLAGCELAGAKAYEGGPFSENALDGQRRLFRLVRPELDALAVQAYLVQPGSLCRNDAFSAIALSAVEVYEPQKEA